MKNTELICKAIQRIENSINIPVDELDVTVWRTSEPVSWSQRRTGEMMKLKPGNEWGKLFDCGWFHFSGQVPRSAAGSCVVLLIDVNCELCIVDERGNPVQGLTCVSSEFDRSLGLPGKRVYRLLEKAVGGEKIDLWADAGNNDLFGCYRGGLKEALIAVRDDEKAALYYDAWVLEELYRQLPRTSARAKRILAALSQMAGALGDLSAARVKSARRILSTELACRNKRSRLVVNAVGHAHLDLAWLWPIRESYRKAARTFSTALRNMDRYPDYRFSQSQPQMFQWMKDCYPDLYERMKRRIADRRMEPVGALWVEPDVNVPCGEAIVRQIILGQRFWQQEFGRTSDIMWLPDSFGYPACLPQIAVKAGLRYFVTQKISGRYPNYSFWWRGIDGTRILSHLLPEATYNSPAAPRSLAKIDRIYVDKKVSGHALLAYGIGDGGGGPGEEHLERLLREQNLEGVPPVTQDPIPEFFSKWEKDSGKFAEWNDELTCPFHHGTYTTLARVKRYNRLAELALRRMEWRYAFAGIHAGVPWPAAYLDEAWKEVLLYQFHDILCGTSITRVHNEVCARYESILREIEVRENKAALALVERINTAGAVEPLVVFNDLAWERTEWLELRPEQWQRVTVPAMGHAVIDVAKSVQPPVAGMTGMTGKLENDKLVLRFDEEGWLISVYDRELRREFLSTSDPANHLVVYSDGGDAWDFPGNNPPGRVIGAFRLSSTIIRRSGPQVVMIQKRIFGRSTIVQKVVLTAGSRRIDFVTGVDWRERNKCLRVLFPVAAMSGLASCEIQYGIQKRATTGPGMKKEAPCQRWIDLSDGNGGVALLNDSKYGCSVAGSVLSLTLLRSPNHPDPVADIGPHKFTYSLMPHVGGAVNAGIVRAAYELNVPLRMTSASRHRGALPAQWSGLSVAGAPTVIVDWVKRAEDGNGLVIRMYESGGSPATGAQLMVSWSVKNATEVSLVETEPKLIEIRKGAIPLSFTPFEIKTVRLE